jgi:hypothetical protein
MQGHIPGRELIERASTQRSIRDPSKIGPNSRSKPKPPPLPHTLVWHYAGGPGSHGGGEGGGGAGHGENSGGAGDHLVECFLGEIPTRKS